MQEVFITVAFRLKPKEEKFFEYLTNHAELMGEIAELAHAALHHNQPLADLVKSADEIEHKADAIVEKITKKLHKTFITPFDREDIFTLAEKLDDIVDCLNDIIERMHIYNVGPTSLEVRQLADIMVKSVNQLRKSISYLDNLKKYQLKIEARCNRVLTLEAEGDTLYRQEMAKLFRECKDPVEIIKWKEILSMMEEVLDTCATVTGALKRVVLKYA